jgi:hypothetical protein
MLAVRKITEDALVDARMLIEAGHRPPISTLAPELLDAMSEDSADRALGRVAVITATAIALLEHTNQPVGG